MQGGVFVEFPTCIDGKYAKARGCADVLTDDVALSFGVAVLFGNQFPQCARAEFAVVEGKGVVPLERGCLCKRQIVGRVFTARVGKVAADAPVRGKLSFGFKFAAETGSVDVARHGHDMSVSAMSAVVHHVLFDQDIVAYFTGKE